MYIRLSKFFLTAAPFAIALVSTSVLFPFIVGKYAWFRIAVDMALIFFVLGLVLQKEGDEYIKRLKRIFRSPLAIALTVFVAIFLLAGFLGINPQMSFWSNFERGEGTLQMLHLYVFFLLLAVLFRREQDWQQIFTASLLTAFLVVAYGIVAGLGAMVPGAAFLILAAAGFALAWFDPTRRDAWLIFGSFTLIRSVLGPFQAIGQRFGEEGFRFAGSIGNSSYTAAYLIFMMFYALYLLFGWRRSLRSRGALVLGITAAVAFSFFILAATRGAFLGLIAAAFVFLLYLAYSRKGARRWLGGAAAALVLTVFLLIQFKDTPAVRALPFARIFDISFSAETFGHRRIMWRIAWDGWKERPILGYGAEGYLQVFDRHFDTRYYAPPAPFGAWFDRAHSIIFDTLVNAGILGLLSYLAVFLALLRMLIRNFPGASIGSSPKRAAVLKALFLALPVAYLVQALILFDVLTIHLNLFLFLAFALHEFYLDPLSKNKDA